eukprot:gnl/TRDRNA2_/TRDRNA2_166668_c1_seq3.p1 gnl/TRDRNA2_/TRDRNA2_166668_c1~~gnl/TRDRNA2_/TRDRNA2_166668_c1_seq3.p1  ORF type:complete len:474 (+),score=157.27 gnl/TRDRNA2_/TRDRNA2_166668_c1_seq3:83-1504(+)
MAPKADAAKMASPRLAPDIDTALVKTKEMLAAAEKLSEKQALVAQKLRAEIESHAVDKNALLKFGEDMKALHGSLGGEREKQNELKKEVDKSREEFELLRASHTRTKSALDSALQAQDAYRKEYHATRVILEKAKEDYAKQTQELAEEREMATELEKYKHQIKDEREKQRANTQKVLNRMNGANTDQLKGTVVQSWRTLVIEAKKTHGFDSQMKKQADELQAMLKNKSEKARQVMSRMNGASTNGLLSNIINYWLQYCADERFIRQTQGEVDALNKKMAESLAKKGEEARKVMERMNGATLSGLMEQTWSHWIEYMKMEGKDKAAQEALKAEAAKLAESMKEKAAEARKVMERMSSDNTSAFLGIIFATWKKWIFEDKSRRHVEEQLEQEEEQIEIMKERMAYILTENQDIENKIVENLQLAERLKPDLNKKEMIIKALDEELDDSVAKATKMQEEFDQMSAIMKELLERQDL